MTISKNPDKNIDIAPHYLIECNSTSSFAYPEFSSPTIWTGAIDLKLTVDELISDFSYQN